jgi:hypothetical protein
MIDEFLQRLKKRNEKYYPGNSYLFPCPGNPHGIIGLRATYKLHQDLCRTLKIPIDKEIIKGPHAFRRTHESEILSSGGSSEMTGRIYGNSPRTIAKHYELFSESRAAAPYIEKLQEHLFSPKEKNEKSEKNEETPETA